MPAQNRPVERRAPILCLKIDVTLRNNELFRDGLKPSVGRGVQRGGPILLLEINITASFNQLFRDGRTPMTGRRVKWSAPCIDRVLVVAQTARHLSSNKNSEYSRVISLD
jgi:hypothetical protein